MFRKLWHTLKDSFDTVIALVISVVTGVAGLIGWGDASYVLAAISTTLGILAFSLTRDRIHREELIRATYRISDNLQSILQHYGTSGFFFTNRSDLPHLKGRVEKASHLDVMGPSLLTFVDGQQELLKRIKDSGGNVRILVSNPENEHLQQLMTLNFTERKDYSYHASRVKVALQTLAPMVGMSSSGGNIEVRITNHMPYGYLALDSFKDSGQIQVEMYLKGPKYNNPIFLLNAERDTKWYLIYQSQFEYLWNNASEPGLL